jgi:hypothetical protein
VISFDNVNQDRLMEFLAHRIADKRVLRYIKRFLKAGIQEDGCHRASDRGVPQGAVSADPWGIPRSLGCQWPLSMTQALRVDSIASRVNALMQRHPVGQVTINWRNTEPFSFNAHRPALPRPWCKSARLAENPPPLMTSRRPHRLRQCG